MFKKKQVKIENVKNFNDAVRAIESFIYLREWSNAKEAIEDVKIKEENAFRDLEEKIKDDYKELQKQRRIYDKNKRTILTLQKKYEFGKIKYDRKIATEKFRVRFAGVKTEIKKLIDTGKYNYALNALNSFFEENQSEHQVVSYYAREKKKILRLMNKGSKQERRKMKEDTELEAIKLAGITLKGKQEAAEERAREREAQKSMGWRARLKQATNFRKRLKEKSERKRLLDEVQILIEEQSKAKQDIAKKKLATMHKGLVKEIEKPKLVGYDMYGKILGSDKISGDCFGFHESKNKYTFYMGDATGHGVRAGLIVSMFSKVFTEEAKKDDLINLTLKVNNTLKEELQSKHFVTGLIFEVDKKYLNAFNVVGLGHEPILIYRAKEQKIERVIAGGVAGGIRLIKKPEDIKPKTLELDDKDIVLCYSDGILEARSQAGEIYGIERLEKIFLKSAKVQTTLKDVYSDIIEELQHYSGGSSFQDDVTAFMFSRNTAKDLLTETSKEIEEIKQKNHLSEKETKRLEGKSMEEAKKEVEDIRMQRQLDNILMSLKALYYTGEYLKLKEEATRYVKEGFVHKKINFYLRKALENEDKYRISQRNTKMQNKYSVLLELYKKKDYKTVIQECNEIIAKDGNV